MKKALFGLATSDEQARRIVDSLLNADFLNEDISIVYPDRNRNMRSVNDREDMSYDDLASRRGSMTTEKHTKAPEGAFAGAATGGVLGGSLGLLAGIGAIAIPGLGPFIAAGPIMAALSGSAVGGSLGLFVGALIGSGIPEYEAKKYEAGLKQGNILISVHVDTDEEIKNANEIMKKEGAKDISVTSEKAKSKF